MPHPLDEFPIHQAPLSMARVATSDRNFYDRCIFHAHDRTGDVLLITGLGVYPNLGVIDAYATVRRGDRQVSVRASDALGVERLDQRVGPFRIEVVEPLQRVRVVCAGDEHGIGFDLEWQGCSPAVDEPHHVHHAGPKVLLDASRFMQTGAWSGVLRVEGDEYEVDPSVWVGTRDRSWGIRPVGEPEPAGRPAGEGEVGGFWWLWIPLRFDDFSLMVIVQEEPNGHRVLNEAVRMWPDGRLEQLGWPEVHIRYRPASRWPEHATISLRGGQVLEVDTRGGIPLNVGAGYGGDPEWGHGQWRGRGWVEGVVHDHGDPEVSGRVPFSVVDHVARATFDGAEGWGIFEHASFGRHDPSGMAGWESTG